MTLLPCRPHAGSRNIASSSSSFGVCCLMALLLLELVVSLQGAAQAKKGTVVPTMKIGMVTLHIGMSGGKVFSQLRQAGYNLKEMAPEGGETVFVVTTEDLKDPVKSAVAMIINDGILHFHGGLLVRIIKTLTRDTETDRELAATLYATVRELEAEGNNHACAVQTTQETRPETPDLETKETILTCKTAGGVYRTTHLRVVTGTRLKQQFPVNVYQELWR
jgi:hypothetical protein